MTKNRAASYGFTLIEVIIALTLLSLILVLLFSTIFTANKTWKITETKIEQNDSLRLVGHFIQRQIIQNVPLMWIDNQKQRLVFEGTSDQLNFTSNLPAHRGGGGINVMRLKVYTDEEMPQLILDYQYADPDNSPFGISDNAKTVTLLQNVNEIKLTYFGKEKIDEPPVWRDDWQNRELLPSLISLKIYSTDKGKDWPELKIPLYANYIKGQPQLILRKTQSTDI